MAVFHIKATDSRDVTGNAFPAFANEVGPGTLIVDANAFLISESGGDGAFLDDSWTATINGTLETFDPVYQGLDVRGEKNAITIGHTGDVLGPNTAMLLYAVDPSTTLHNRLTNVGTISGGVVGLQTTASGFGTLTLVKNSGLIHGGDAGLEHLLGTLTLVNSGTIAGGNFSIHATTPGSAQPIAHITNSGAFLGSVVLADSADTIKNSGGIFGAVDLGDGNDTFTNFIKVGNHVRSGSVSGFIDLGDGADHFNGGQKGELVLDADGSDTYKLGGGSDTYFADGGGTGTDTIDGGAGVDVYNAQFATFTVLVNLDTKPHGGLPAQFAQGADVGDVGNTDKVIGFEDATGSFAADLLIGTSGANSLAGQAGTDDLIGLGGRDTLFGGSEADRFIYQKLSDSGVKASTRDLILDFNQGTDHMNLVDLEASVGHAFAFIGTASFHHTAGELRQSDSGANTIVSLDSNGDGKADFSIELAGHMTLTAGDFTL